MKVLEWFQRYCIVLVAPPLLVCFGALLAATWPESHARREKAEEILSSDFDQTLDPHEVKLLKRIGAATKVSPKAVIAYIELYCGPCDPNAVEYRQTIVARGLFPSGNIPAPDLISPELGPAEKTHRIDVPEDSELAKEMWRGVKKAFRR